MYNIWNQLRNRSGWTWDQITGELHTSDTVWETEIDQNPRAKKLHGYPMPHCWELDEIFTGTIATGENAFSGGNLKERFSEEWKEKVPTRRKQSTKGSKTETSTALLTKAIEEFRATQGTAGSIIRQAVRRVMETYRMKEGWTQGQIDKALDLFKEEAMAEIFIELENDYVYQEHWLKRQIS